MKNKIQLNSITRHMMPFATKLTCLVAVSIAVAQPILAKSNFVPPPMPPGLEVPTGNKLFLAGHATGTQQYMCLFNGTSFAWTFFGPQATLFDGDGKQTMTHFLSPNPVETGAARATWQHSQDSSIVWAAPITSTMDPAFVAPGAIPWLLLEVKDTQAGPDGGDKMTKTTFVQRLSTAGGIAPTSGCAAQADIGKKALVPYTTDYFFYKAAGDKNAAAE